MSVSTLNVDRSNLFTKLNELKEENARFLTITTLDLGEILKVVYHFEKDREVINIIINVGKTESIPSITSIYGAAFVAENEVQDLFNLTITDLNVDFGGKMLKIETAKSTTLLKPALGTQPPIMRFYGRCREKCPAMINIPKYIRQIAAGDPAAAYNTIIEQAPLPTILGRVCFAPCEIECRQEKNEVPIQIRLLKRYAADALESLRRDVKRLSPTGKKVAVIGGGPSGVTAAFYLGMQGHDVTVYEKNARSGGAMLWGIPKYKLPKDVLQEEIMARFEEAGVKREFGVEIHDLDSLLEGGYDAVYVAIGAQKPNMLRVEGEDSQNVIGCMEFLSAVNVDDESPDVGNEVMIIGGGNSAIDSARTCIRLGAKHVILYYRRTETDMPALLHKIHAAMREGVSFDLLSQPIKIIPGERPVIVFQCMVPGEPDASGRRRPVPVEDCIFLREADTIIKAIGTRVDVPEDFNLEVDRRGLIVVDDGYKTSRKRVWAGGDAVFGPTSVIEAIRDGRAAASSIDKFLGGKGLKEPTIELGEFVSKPTDIEELIGLDQVKVRELPVNTRVRNFDEVELGYTLEESLREAKRCWRCDWNE